MDRLARRVRDVTPRARGGRRASSSGASGVQSKRRPPPPFQPHTHAHFKMTAPVIAIATALLAAGGARAGVVTVARDGWYDGRATFFGASDALVQTFERIR